MQLISGLYHHSKIGFGKVVLKWYVERGKVTDAYVTVKGIIMEPWTWRNLYPLPFMEDECKRFDDWVLSRYGNDVTVQD